jgi:hypothetical protein
MDAFEIDLDSECVWLDDAWLTRDDLVRKVKAMIDAGDYQIARPSQALESLTRALAQARLLALRISPELSEALNAAAQQTGRPVGALAREAIGAWLSGMSAAAAAQAPMPMPMPLPEPEPAAQAQQQQQPVAAAAPAEPSPTVEVSPSLAAAQLTTEPVAADEAANAVALTPKRAGHEDVEERWFDK